MTDVGDRTPKNILVLANFAAAVPLSRDQLTREVRQYQYYPDYNYQQYGNGYTTYPQYGQYQYDGQNGQSIQNQQEIFMTFVMIFVIHEFSR